jgi:hypothetical protein
MWGISGKISSFIARLTAPGEPGTQKIALFWEIPAIALERMALLPISR